MVDLACCGLANTDLEKKGNAAKFIMRTPYKLSVSIRYFISCLVEILSGHLYEPEVQQLGHEVDDGLRLVEGRRGHINIQRHLPVGGPD
jgi:hypothetical protein